MSQICKFYQRGKCKYGHQCHFLHQDPYDHSYSYGNSQDRYTSQQSYGNFYKNNNSRNYGPSSDGDYSRSNERNSHSRQNYGGNYSQNYYANSRSNYTNNSYTAKQSYHYDRYHVDNRNSQRESKSPDNITPVEFLEIVNFELTQHDRSHTWPFSVIAPVKDFGNIPGFKDYSPEEIRFQYYEALSTNNLFEYEKNLHEAQAEIEVCRQIFRSKSSEAINILRTMMQQSKTPQSSDISTGFAPAASTFTFDVRKLHENQPTESMEPFSFPNDSFSSPNQNSGQFFMNPSTFSTNEMSQTALFGQPTVVYNLGNAMSNQFQPESQMNTTFSFNLNHLNSDQRNSVEPPVDNSIYSKLETLPREILESFQAKTFKLGKVPTVPPPRELCFS